VVKVKHKLSDMTKDTFSKIAIGAISVGAITMYISSVPFAKSISSHLEVGGSIFFYGGIVSILALVASRIGK